MIGCLDLAIDVRGRQVVVQNYQRDEAFLMDIFRYNRKPQKVIIKAAQLQPMADGSMAPVGGNTAFLCFRWVWQGRGGREQRPRDDRLIPPPGPIHATESEA